MGDLPTLDLAARLFLSALFAGFIGLERETHGRPAGLRTHMLVAMGSSLLMILSIHGFSNNYDPARLAAQVVSGIGFLGAGTILREGATVKGLTTAASLWVSAGIGLTIGGGFYLPGVLATVLAVLSLLGLERLEKKFISPRCSILEARSIEQPGQMELICAVLNRRGFTIRSIEWKKGEESGEIIFIIKFETARRNPAVVLEELRDLPGIKQFSWRQSNV